MVEFLKSFSSMSLALALLPIREIENSLAPGESRGSGGAAVKAMDAITIVTVENFGGRLRSAFSAIDGAQRRVIARAVRMWGSSQPVAGNTTCAEGWESPAGQAEAPRPDFHLRW
jgi:hypothetical protein